MEVHERVMRIQQDLKAPRGQFNLFGKYKYRSCEDILEAVKPLLLREECFLTLCDDLLLIGNRYYVRATARLNYGGQEISVSAYAREEDTRKGMDESQITGAASSYARKYALNGMLLIDDTKDADTQDNTEKDKKKASRANTTKLAPEAPQEDIQEFDDPYASPSGVKDATEERAAPQAIKLADTIVVDEVRKITGIKKGTNKPWEKYIIKAAEGTGKQAYETFDKKFAEMAKEASGSGRKMIVTYHVDTFGNKIDSVTFEDELA